MAPGPKDLRRPGSHRWGRGEAPRSAPLTSGGPADCAPDSERHLRSAPLIPRPLVVDTTGRR